MLRPTIGNYGPSSFLSRTVIKTECQTESDWVKFLNKKSSASIIWNFYWWKCPPPLLWSPGSDHIFLVGLRKATFDKDNRLLRQFQYEQGMPSGKRRKPFTLVDTNHTSIRNMLLSLEMVDRVDQSRFTFTEWLQNTLTGWWTRLLIKKLRWLLWENNFSEIIKKDTFKTTMNSKEGSRITKYLAQRKSMINKKRKEWRQSDLLIFGFEHAYLKVDVKTLMFGNYLGFSG